MTKLLLLSQIQLSSCQNSFQCWLAASKTVTDNQILWLWESSKWMEGADEANTATHDGKSLALAIFEEFQILFLEVFTVLQTVRNVKVPWQMAGFPYHEAVSKAAQVPGSLGSPGCVHLLRGQLLFEHSLESCMVCQHPPDKGSEKMGQGLQMASKTSSETPISSFSHRCNNWYLSSNQEKVTKHSLKSMREMRFYGFISTVLKYKDAYSLRNFSLSSSSSVTSSSYHSLHQSF